MKKIVNKWFTDWEKEEKWLNEMAAKGLVLTSVSFCRFEFEESLPGEYGVKIELLENLPNHPESEQYIRFVEGTGAEQVAQWYRWVYFRKKTADGPFELFSDAESKIKHINRILILLGVIGGMNLLVGASNIFLAIFNNSGINWMGVINVCLALIIAIIFVKQWKKKRKLEKDMQIFEG